MKKTVYLSFTILLLLLGNITEAQTTVINKTIAFNTEIINDYLAWEADKKLPIAMKTCPYVTDNLKRAYSAFMEKYKREFFTDEMDINPLTCCCGRDGVKVKTIKGNYVLYEGKTDSKKYLYARLVKVQGKTLIDGLGQINMPMIKGSLKKALWHEAQNCNTNFEDTDAKENRHLIDDSKNGYLKVWGDFPPCGCNCNVTVGAYKDQYGFYTFLKQETENCDYTTDISSNRLLSEVLPQDFGMHSFMSDATQLPPTDIALFTLNVAIPQKGTETKVSLKILAHGLLYTSNTPLVYYSAHNEKTKMLEVIQQLAKDENNTELLNKLWHQNIVDLSSEEQAVITKLRKNASYGEISVEDVQKDIDTIKLAYTYYSQIEYDSVLLGWNKQKARFFIKERYKAKQKMSFAAFLQQIEYWLPNC